MLIPLGKASPHNGQSAAESDGNSTEEVAVADPPLAAFRATPKPS
jgi:hypothetical protein